MLWHQHVIGELVSLRQALQQQQKSLSREGVRELLARKAGSFQVLAPMSPEEVERWFGGRPLAAVDGSVNVLGGPFPRVLEFFQALGKTSTGRRVAAARVFTPLLPEALAELESLAAKEGLPQELALIALRSRRLSALELEVGCRLVEEEAPRLLLFDGGFMRYARHAPREWAAFCRLALERGVIAAGVIEEVESFGLAKICGVFAPAVYDRDLLLGVLEPGECLFVPPELKVKGESLYTVFARLSCHPQPVAVDFLQEQAAFAPQVMRYLYTITPSGGRGIPLFLDLVDAEVRLGKRDVELLADTYLGQLLREIFFTPQRERRDF
ncbi:DNA double-strand break repair nuclease NurA [Desulfovirgula thermocuniculi]|uniref:DNA double-strand break repair nuclease NurA n=1 Tax=Desulfovirgula thermocuniculi TaxID=348842 RepID=UPI0004292CD9|nr:DNA double-strand break repair nuclease NurA [Desulfovirgula thermocuniculi]